MSFPNETKVEQLRRLFEGREAIYVEKGALRVKVTDISADLAQRCISAEVEEGLVQSRRRECNRDVSTSFTG